MLQEEIVRLHAIVCLKQPAATALFHVVQRIAGGALHDLQQVGQANEATRHARVIAYTGNPTLDESLAERLFVTVLQKPATPDVVVATVKQAASL